MIWFHLAKAVDEKLKDPNFRVQMEIERRRPGYRRRLVTSFIVVLLYVAFLLFFELRGWEFFWSP